MVKEGKEDKHFTTTIILKTNKGCTVGRGCRSKLLYDSLK